MKTFILMPILLLTFSTFAQNKVNSLTELKKSNEGRTNGTVKMDPTNCKLVLIRDGLEISLLPVKLKKQVRDKTTKEIKTIDVDANNFLITFPDGDTTIADIAGTNPTRPACFHSITTQSPDYRVRPASYNQDGQENCRNRPDGAQKYSVTDELRHISKTEYDKQVRKNGDGFQMAASLKVQSGVGLGFYTSSHGKQTGPNVETKDLLPSSLADEDKKTLSDCEKQLASQKAPAPITRPGTAAEKVQTAPK